MALWIPTAPTVRFFGEVNDESIEMLIERIETQWAINSKNKAPVQLLIHSIGGEAKTASAFLYIMRDMSIPLHTFGYSIESAAVLLYLAGNVRFADRTRTKFLLHEAKAGIHGEYSVKTATQLVQELKEVNSTFAQCISEQVGCTLDTIVKLMREEIWLDAQQAKNLGIVHEILA